MTRAVRKKISVRQLLSGAGIIVIALLLIDQVLVSRVMSHVFEDFHRLVDSSSAGSTISMADNMDLSNEELAWHARNNYGWDCDEIVMRGEMSSSGYFSTTCSNGRILRVYPRGYTYPRITNMSGGNY